MGDRASTNITQWTSSIEEARDARRDAVDEGRAPGSAGDVRGEGRARRGDSCGRLRAACLVTGGRMQLGRHCAACRRFNRDAVGRLAQRVGTEEGVGELGSSCLMLSLCGYAAGRLPTEMLGGLALHGDAASTKGAKRRDSPGVELTSLGTADAAQFASHPAHPKGV